MELFDDYERTDNSRSPHSEAFFTFLNRSARPDVGNIRAELERWFAGYPAEHQHDLRQAFRSTRDDQHLAAWWELYLYHLFTVLDFNVEVHPEIEGETTRPDFKVTGPLGAFLLEAATTHGGIASIEQTGVRRGWIIDALNSAPHPNFMVALHFELIGTHQPRTRQLVREVTEWLDSLDPDEMPHDQDLQERHFSIGDEWRIQLRPIPKALDFRGVCEGDELVGITRAGGGFVNDRQRLLAKLRDKSGRYGSPDVPIVVAVNLVADFGDVRAYEQALFGSEAIRMPVRGGEGKLGEAEVFRQQDGFWMRNGRPLATRVSAALVGPGLGNWTLTSKWPLLWRNPWATHPLAIDLPLPQGIGDQDGRVSYIEASTTPAELFAPAEDWPVGTAGDGQELAGGQAL